MSNKKKCYHIRFNCKICFGQLCVGSEFLTMFCMYEKKFNVYAVWEFIYLFFFKKNVYIHSTIHYSGQKTYQGHRFDLNERSFFFVVSHFISVTLCARQREAKKKMQQQRLIEIQLNICCCVFCFVLLPRQERKLTYDDSSSTLNLITTAEMNEYPLKLLACVCEFARDFNRHVFKELGTIA